MAYVDALAALADPTRRSVFETLRSGPRSVGELALGLPVSRPAVSQHLRVLKDAGLVRERRDGTRNFYSVNGAGLAELREYFEGFWDEALGAFKEAVEKGDEMQSTHQAQRIEPVRKSVTVNAPVEHAFAVFTERMGEWWPLSHSVHEELAERAGLEPRLGGEIYELWRDGREPWGTITAWEPPHRLVYTWHPGHDVAEATEVEVRFTPRDDSTLVELEHRGWEARGARAAEIRERYDEGWDPVLERYVAAATGARAGT